MNLINESLMSANCKYFHNNSALCLSAFVPPQLSKTKK